MNQQALAPHEYFKKHQKELLAAWQSELKKNDGFLAQNNHHKALVTEQANQYLTQFINLLSHEEIPSFSIKAFEGALKFWHPFLKEHQNSGLTIRDMAMMILSLKATLSKLSNPEFDDHGFTLSKDLTSFQSLLDFLGLLTFEIYRTESETSTQNPYTKSLATTAESNPIFGSSDAMKRVQKMIGLIIDNDITVLLEGESGTGKDVIATYIHEHSKRQKKPFIPVNCGAIPKELIESELFGHEKGAFTGAEARHPGKFEQAEGGTLFLDEVGELPLEVQVKLLRVLQNKEIIRVGGHSKIKINARIIAATNRSLKSMVDKKLFRLDLYYRLNVFPIHLPALKERKEDILPLAYSFIDHFSKAFSLPLSTLTKSAENYLLTHHWEGNIRELENVIQRCVIIAQGQSITPDLLTLIPGELPLSFGEIPEKENRIPESTVEINDIRPLEEVEKEAILKALSATKNNMVQTAKLLGISRTTLYNKMEKYQLGEK